ncbi:MAG: FKBP-type peptidyl-prolyl cis-trans isomerase [Tannerellaceae bacterium]|jgi:peptidylprolyl isomerase/FKBP-type peptidyl-prolyl cis-trans isomerase FklB|nr:FKBP-type peptidyl-prolyl cis-trans isomerase [Tannerellaceae bacterium]
MRKYFYLLSLALSATVLFPSCGDSDDDVVIDEAWKSANEEAFNKLTFDPSYERIASLSNSGHIYYKVIKTGSGIKPIYFTSRVSAYYTGSLIDGTVFDKAEYPDKLPVDFSISGVVKGWQAALQHMHEGDRWEVWIPQELGYAAVAQERSGQTSIPAYSTLKFEIEIVKVFGIEEP